VPLTAIVEPTRTARLNPIVSSKGEPERACRRSTNLTLSAERRGNRVPALDSGGGGVPALRSGEPG
jgi:hypothetical protein